MTSNSVLEDLPQEDQTLLVRHVGRVSGWISLKSLSEHFPDMTFETSVNILEKLVESGHLKHGKRGHYTFVDSAGDVETGDLEEELKAMADFKKITLERNRTSTPSNPLPPRACDDSAHEETESDEESCAARRKHHGFKSYKDLHENTFEHGKFRRRKSHNSASTLGIPLNIDKIRRFSLDETLFASGQFATFQQSTPESRKFKHIILKSLARRRSSFERMRRSSNSDFDESDSEKSDHSPPPELNKTIYPEDESPTSDSGSLSSELVASIDPAHVDQSQEAETTSQPNSAFFTTAETGSTCFELVLGMATLDLGSSRKALSGDSGKEVPGAIFTDEEGRTQVVSTDSTQASRSEEIPLGANDPECSQKSAPGESSLEAPGEVPQEVSILESVPEHSSASVDVEEEPAMPSNPDEPDGAKENLGEDIEVIDDPCRALELYCQFLHLDPPAYDTTYLPMDRVYYCLLLVRNTNFLSHPTRSTTERAAKEVVAREAIEKFGITASMVARGVFPNARRNVRTEESDTKTHVLHAEP